MLCTGHCYLLVSLYIIGLMFVDISCRKANCNIVDASGGVDVQSMLIVALLGQDGQYATPTDVAHD